jgi:hypothetical protein
VVWGVILVGGDRGRLHARSGNVCTLLGDMYDFPMVECVHARAEMLACSICLNSTVTVKHSTPVLRSIILLPVLRPLSLCVASHSIALGCISETLGCAEL